MRGKLPLAAAGLMMLGLAREAPAQQKQGIGIMPFAGYWLPFSNLAEESSVAEFKAKGALAIGAEIQLGVNKNLSVAAGGGTTISGSMDVDVPGVGNVANADQSTLQVYGSVVFRPGGRLASGTVSPLYLEGGAGATMYRFGNLVVPSAGFGGSASDFNTTKPFFFVGAGYNVPVGPRASVQIFARAQAITSYSSKALDDFNAAPPVSNVKGSMVFSLLAGAGFRFGR